MGGTGNRAVLMLHKCNAAMACLKILFVYNIFTFSNIGASGIYGPNISPYQVSVTGVNNVSLKCLFEARPSDCSGKNEIQWLFFDRPLKSSEKYEIEERKTKTKCNVLMITIFNIAYADEGTYGCRQSCKYFSGVYSASTALMHLKVLSGMNNCAIISSAFSKGVRVGEIFRYKEKGGKKINAEKM